MTRLRRDWRFLGIIALLTVLAAARVASTWRVYGETLDEPVHLAAGYQWLTSRSTIDLGHPPLVRVLCALPLWMSGHSRPVSADPIQQGNDLLYASRRVVASSRGSAARRLDDSTTRSPDRYETSLALARSGNLVMLIAAIAGVALWARRTFSRGVAVLAVAIFTSTPAVLGHAGLITNDLGAAATLVLALLAFERYLDAPSYGRAALAGAAIALGLLTKFSFLVFFPAAALVVWACRWRAPRWKDAGIAVLVAFVVVWAGYKFDFGSPKELSKEGLFLFEYAAPKPLRTLTRPLAEVPMPAPAFPLGLATLAFHNQQGHDAYLFGETSRHGWWYYFPVVLFYKTPIPLLLLAAWGIAILRDRTRLLYAGVALAILLVAMTASINIGVRHVLPIYAPLSILAAYAATAIWSRATTLFSRGALAALLLWLFGGVALGGRDMLPWFNEAAQPNPASIAVDSNLDWGQDTLRLARAVREMQIPELHAAIFTNARLDRHGIRALPLDPYVKTPGWCAVSEMMLAIGKPKGEYAWLSAYRPVRRVGSSIRLYSIP